jgi:hypothetical protein
LASTAPKTPCVTCGKGVGLFKCEGYAQTFCTKHAVEHRQTLHHQLEEIISEHDTLRQTTTENKDQKHFSIGDIDEWEQKSIQKIQQIAHETHQKIAERADMHTSKFFIQILTVQSFPLLHRNNIREIKSSDRTNKILIIGYQLWLS